MKRTQEQRVLDALKAAGATGITQRDFLGKTIDDDPQGEITRVGARILELREAGHPILVIGRRAGFAVYRLATRPCPSTGAATQRSRNDGDAPDADHRSSGSASSGRGVEHTTAPGSAGLPATAGPVLSCAEPLTLFDEAAPNHYDTERAA